MMNKGSPIFVYTFKAQHISAIRDKTGAIIEGADDEIVGTHYAFAMQQQLNDETNIMEWKLCELQIVGIEQMW